MAFGGEVDDPVGLVLVEDPVQFSSVKNVYFLENIIGRFFNVAQILQVACVREGIEIDDLIFRVFRNE